jgi:hypothetical protein
MPVVADGHHTVDLGTRCFAFGPYSKAMHGIEGCIRADAWNLLAKRVRIFANINSFGN